VKWKKEKRMEQEKKENENRVQNKKRMIKVRE
jgi:hypothetical protein